MGAIAAESVTVREIVAGDIPDVVAACNDELIQRFLPLLPSPYTEADARAFAFEMVPARWAAGGAEFVVADPASGRLLGCIGVHQRGRGVAEIGYWTAPWGRARGAASAAARAASAWAFSHGYTRLELLTDQANGLSQRVALAAGYAREGLRRGGGEQDRLVWSRLPTDPPGPAPRLLPDLPGGELSDGTVTLRPLAACDADGSYRIHQLPELVASRVPPEPLSREQAERRCAYAEAQWLAGASAALTVRDAVTDTYAGEISLYYQEPQTGQAMVGCSLDRPWRGRGYASRAVRLLAGWAFARTGIVRLIAGTAPGNEASQRALKAAGFRLEGYQRSRLPGAGGTRIDDLLFALLPEDA